MPLTKPPRLRRGDRVAAVTLSWGGPGKFPHRYEAGKAQLVREFGLEVVETRHALRDPAWIAANPKARADDLMEAFADPSIRGIVSTIGGDDSVRILPHLDLEVIRRHPKVFLGYSDTTVTHLACFRAGLASFYGPTIMAGFGENAGVFPYMAASVRRTLFSPEPVGILEPNRDGWTVEHLDWADPANQARRRKLNPSAGWRVLQGTGVASGRLLGGCADVLEFLKGTEWWPPPEAWEGAVLFLETSEDAPSPQWVKWWLRNYATQGILQRLAGLLVGRPGGQVPESAFEQYDKVILQVVREESGLTSLPIVTRMDFGHTDPMLVLPYGVRVGINADAGTLCIQENAVT